ncbi:hypothetical protein L804_00060 [Cryptococcus deuterogattii 2001/935-1]|nr:hypothetical protein L804_00060 [Cryptococcus deuterogattii 2001/935-1]
MELPRNIVLTPTSFPIYRRRLLAHLSTHAPHLASHLLHGPAEPYRKPQDSLVHLVEAALFCPYGQLAGDRPPCALVSTTGFKVWGAQLEEWDEWARNERALREVFKMTFGREMWGRLGRMWCTKEIWEVLESEYMPSPIERQSQIVHYLRSTRLPSLATQEDMLRLWETFNALVIEARDTGLYMKEIEVVEGFLMAIGRGNLAESVKQEFFGMLDWVVENGRWRSLRRILKMRRPPILLVEAPEDIHSPDETDERSSGPTRGRTVLAEKDLNGQNQTMEHHNQCDRTEHQRRDSFDMILT